MSCTSHTNSLVGGGNLKTTKSDGWLVSSYAFISSKMEGGIGKVCISSSELSVRKYFCMIDKVWKTLGSLFGFSLSGTMTEMSDMAVSLS